MNVTYLVGDFETTVYENQEYTEVWAGALVELFTENVIISHSIEEHFTEIRKFSGNLIVYYHNLKFDGQFWLSYLLRELNWKQNYVPVYDENGVELADGYFLPKKLMKNKTFSYSISSMGQWYKILIKCDDRFIELRDSLKLLPFSVKEIGRGFKTKHQKLDMEYKGFRYAGCPITDKEKSYIANDVMVVKEALEVMFNEGHNRLTIGSCCLSEFKSEMDKVDYENFFPDLTLIKLSKEHKFETAYKWLKRTYRGGWCYLVKGKEAKIHTNGTTADVNSLYPSVMSGQSGNKYPVGRPTFWVGNFIPDEAQKVNRYYFLRVKTRFKLKRNMLPTIQIKGNLLYKGTEWLETSDYYDKRTGKYYEEYYDRDGKLHDTRIELLLTETDYRLMKQHYSLIDFEILDGCYFSATVGLFDEYIDKYKEIKMNSTGALRTLAKLFLNNLYGKFGTNDDSSFKVAYLHEDGSVKFFTVFRNDKQTGFVAIASAVTSYAREFTINAAQKNYHGKNKRGFIYADTDSIHCDLEPDEITGIKVHPTDFLCWKLESNWDKAIFVRQKTYMEHIVKSDGKPVANPYYDIKCAGMPESSKNIFLSSMKNMTEFKIGLKVGGKLMPKRIQGGVVLVDTDYEMR